MAKINYEIIEHSLEGRSLVMLKSDTSETEAYVEYTLDIDEDYIEVKVSQGEATTVPYGEQDVVYDDGVSVDDVYADEAITIMDIDYLDEDTDDVTLEEAAAILNINKDELVLEVDRIGQEIISDFAKYYADWYKDNGDFDPYDWME